MIHTDLLRMCCPCTVKHATRKEISGYGGRSNLMTCIVASREEPSYMCLNTLFSFSFLHRALGQNFEEFLSVIPPSLESLYRTQE
jgi:hypothetical protein